MSFLEIFPPLVLEMVFSHLTITEIVKSTLISPGARNVISNSVQLMQNIRFKITGRRMRPPTRKYSKIDFFNLNRRSTFKDLPVCLSQLTFEGCKMEADVFHALLSKITETLKLLIVNRCKLYDNGCYSNENLDVQTETKLEPLLFPKLRTLILVDLKGRPEFLLLSIIRATNLVELGMVKILVHCEELDRCVAEQFVDLIKSNSKLAMLHIPPFVTPMFLASVEENHEFEYCLEELNLGFVVYEDAFDFSAMNFLESQRSTLKSLRIEGCMIKEEFTEKLLSMNLIRLELHHSAINLPFGIVGNSSIESLSFVDYNGYNLRTIRRIKIGCQNVVECVALLDPEPLEVFGSDSWKYYEFDAMIPERISWADLRSVRFAGVAFTIEFIERHPYKKCFYVFNDESKEVTVESPYSILKFIKNEKPSENLELFRCQSPTSSLELDDQLEISDPELDAEHPDPEINDKVLE